MANLNIVGFPSGLHMKLKIEATRRKTTMKALVVEAVQDLLKKKDKR